MEYKHILLGCDGSELADDVYERCAFLARLTRTTADIVYVNEETANAHLNCRDIIDDRRVKLSEGVPWKL